MRALGLTATAAMIGLAAAGCHKLPKRPPQPGRPFVVSDKLDCPVTQGRLTRQSQSADGQTCVYNASNGAVVTLQRVGLEGKSATDFLQGLEASVSAGMPKHGDMVAAEAAAGAPDSKVSDWNRSSSTSSGKHDKADIDLPGLHVHADGSGKATIRLPGVSIDADDDKAKIKTSWGGVKNAVIDADKTGAEIRAANSDSANVDAVYILASEAAGPDGVHVVGYEARGPASGPLVVASFKGKTYEQGHEHYSDADHSDIKRLIDRNLK